MKTIYLLRHAKAAAGDAAMSDENRPLNARGLEACEIIGKYIKNQKIKPDIVLCSTAVRTKETWARVASAAGISPQLEYSKKLYLASSGEIMRHINNLGDGLESVLVVGHNPGIHECVIRLCNSAASHAARKIELKFPTAALAIIENEAMRWAEVAPETGYLKEFVTPGE